MEALRADFNLGGRGERGGFFNAKTKTQKMISHRGRRGHRESELAGLVFQANSAAKASFFRRASPCPPGPR